LAGYLMILSFGVMLWTCFVQEFGRKEKHQHFCKLSSSLGSVTHSTIPATQDVEIARIARFETSPVKELVKPHLNQ
jgi:hypothetical protein